MTPPPIVIVEDDRNISELLGYAFAREGFAPVLLRDGRAAEEYVASHAPPAAVLLDVMLPYRDGFTVAAGIRADARWRNVAVVMLTAKALAADLERGRGVGVTEYVTKPFHPRALVDRIKSLLQEPAPA